jgi:hypothetical protein
MPRAPARIRKRYVEGSTEVCPWDVEETLLYGITPIFGPPCIFKTMDEWRREWERWRDVILPKSLEYRPGARPVAQYVLGEIPAREMNIPLPEPNGFWRVEVRDRSGRSTRHWLNVPEPFMEREVKHLTRLGIVDAEELRRHRRDPEAATGYSAYPLEASLHE